MSEISTEKVEKFLKMFGIIFVEHILVYDSIFIDENNGTAATRVTIVLFCGINNFKI